MWASWDGLGDWGGSFQEPSQAVSLEQRPEFWILASSIQNILKECVSSAFYHGYLLTVGPLVLLRRNILRRLELGAVGHPTSHAYFGPVICLGFR